MLGPLPEQFFGLARKMAAKDPAGYDVIHLGQATPICRLRPNIVESFKRTADDPKFHRYSPFRGYDSLKEAVAAFCQREYGV